MKMTPWEIEQLEREKRQARFANNVLLVIWAVAGVALIFMTIMLMHKP